MIRPGEAETRLTLLSAQSGAARRARHWAVLILPHVTRARSGTHVGRQRPLELWVEFSNNWPEGLFATFGFWLFATRRACTGDVQVAPSPACPPRTHGEPRPPPARASPRSGGCGSCPRARRRTLSTRRRADVPGKPINPRSDTSSLYLSSDARSCL